MTTGMMTKVLLTIDAWKVRLFGARTTTDIPPDLAGKPTAYCVGPAADKLVFNASKVGPNIIDDPNERHVIGALAFADGYFTARDVTMLKARGLNDDEWIDYLGRVEAIVVPATLVNTQNPRTGGDAHS